MSVNERLFNLLKKQGYTQKQFAVKTGISEQTISAWKKRNTDPPCELLSTIADFLNVSIEFLVTGKETTNIFVQPELSVDEENLMNIYRKLTSEDKIKINKIITDILIESLLDNNGAQTTSDEPLNFPSENSEVVKIGLAAFGGNGYIEKTISKEDAERGLREIEKL